VPAFRIFISIYCVQKPPHLTHTYYLISLILLLFFCFCPCSLYFPRLFSGFPMPSSQRHYVSIYSPPVILFPTPFSPSSLNSPIIIIMLHTWMDGCVCVCVCVCTHIHTSIFGLDSACKRKHMTFVLLNLASPSIYLKTTLFHFFMTEKHSILCIGNRFS
jgi:hypothetical protein